MARAIPSRGYLTIPRVGSAYSTGAQGLSCRVMGAIRGQAAMRPNPIADAIEFLTGSQPVLCLPPAGRRQPDHRGDQSHRDPGQRNGKDISIFVLRFFIGCLWWQQSLWKLPPTYTDHADGTGGLRYWVDRMVDGAAFQLQSDFVHYVVQPYFLVFAPIVYATEVFIGASL